MSKENDLTMLGEVLRDHGGPLKDLCRKLCKSPEKWGPAFSRFLRGENPWSRDLLEPLETVLKLSAFDVFSAKEAFIRTPDEDMETADLLMEGIHIDFRKVFLEGEGKIETDVASATLRPYRLKRLCPMDSILTELGGEEAVEITLAHMFELLKLQGCGQKGVLLTEKFDSNIFFIRNVEGTLYSVSCNWSGMSNGWELHAALPKSAFNNLNAGTLIFIRDSGL